MGPPSFELYRHGIVTDSDFYSDGHSDSDSNPDSDSYSDGHADAHTYANSYADGSPTATPTATPTPTLARTVTSTQSGNWSNPATWGGLTPPGNGDIAMINNDVTVTTNTTIGDGSNSTVLNVTNGTLPSPGRP